ncbi:MAG TPA: MOSC and FAD-binding oxidoreductase domain-containing protein [Mycobacteriales bacterium]|nr:MOSC and FAD-binding oxidoreductase domain-containing protein [Mycobacteriales bacterium]
MATLLSVNVGMPKNVAWEGRTVFTGVWKSPVAGPCPVRRLNLDGDGQGDRNGHGGEQRAVLVYQIDSYRHWQRHFDRPDFEYGQFGENFTVDGLSDDEVCIGDRYRIGTAEFEVTQPRVTCFRVGMRMGAPELPALLVSHRRPGFYFRVITEGEVRAGDPIVRTRVGRHALSVADVDALLYLPDRDQEKLRAAADIPALSPGWQQSFRELIDGGQPPSVGVEPGWQGFRRLRVRELVPESSTVLSVHLAAEDGAPLPRPEAGQYITLRAAGAGDPAPVRSYSLSSSPAAEGYRISVKREQHGLVSAFLHSRLRVGTLVDVAAPRGEFVLAGDDSPILLISAGIGVTPVLSMLHQLSADRSDRAVWWIHISRDPQQHAFSGEAHRLLQALPHAHEHVFYTATGGRPTRSDFAALDLPPGAAAYICGPAAFMDDMQKILIDLGIGPDRVHTELFGALPAINPGITDARRVAPHPPSGPPGAGPRITFARSGLTVRWDDRHGSVLELADACDVPTRWSCRTGVCHTCVTPLLSGDIAYRPDPLEMPPPGEALICCARPCTDLVVDL